jgi:hypothetical protein
MPSPTVETGTAELERAELKTVLESHLFARSPTLAHLLTYLCEKKFAGETEQIKEYSIALDVFGRPESFDQDTDSIVRVQVNRLRKRLAEYYAGEREGHALRITIPVGHYVPRFEAAGAEPEKSAGPAEISPPTSQESAVPKPRPRAWMLVPAGFLLVAVVGGMFLARDRLRPRSVAAPSLHAQIVEAPAVGLPVGDEVRVLAGASRSYVDRAGKLWNPDVYFSGGKAVRTPVQHIWRTQDSSIYRSSRQGDFRYDIPLKAGVYELRLHFAETFYGPESVGGGGEGSRVMTVMANGKALLNDLDVVLDAGGSRTADVKVFTGISPAADGQLHLSFSSAQGGNAMLSAIEILPGFPRGLRPVRIVARDVPYYSNDSRWWGPDNYFKGGQLSASEDPATDADDPEMYETERWGHFSYAIPVAPGRYAVTLHFVEHRFDVRNRDRYGEASSKDGGRMFSVFCNGKVIVRDLDLIREAGENRPLVRRVTGLGPNGQGKLLLEFVPTRNYATVSAIEVVAQGD